MVPATGDILFVRYQRAVDRDGRITPRSTATPGGLLGESSLHGWHLAASGQILREYLVVATRPLDANGLGLHVR